ncbi:MAG: phenylalanine--tRNA ligase subunit beta [Bacteroidales bacterium]|nr:phenylalanine--tRNA ligase subunit beta [Bacteroidales bacterium]
MKISYNWLKQYIKIDLPAAEVGRLLTDCGLEVEGIEKYESIKGGLKGFVIGEVVEKTKHPNADKLSLTKVNTGSEKLLSIVCGAPNVEAGQKVVVAIEGTKIFSPKGEFEIKKSKIRGEFSEGMICAEDELGTGTSHEGIIVLDNSAKTGTPAKEYFNVYEDEVFEIGLTPNRADATSHIGVARDLSAVLKTLNFRNSKSVEEFDIKYPSVDNFKIDNEEKKIEVVIEDAEACPRYSGITITGVEIKESPEWLKNYMKAIGLNPINNIVDITNYILHEFGQPLHAFDADEIKGNKVIVKKLAQGTKFITLDGVERQLSKNDLMICNATEPMCIGGVYGGLHSGITEKTKNIFLESAYFNPMSIRRSSKLHNLRTDAAFRFEKGTDPNNTVYAMKRAIMLMKELGGGKISSDIVDVYPAKIENFKVELRYKFFEEFVGQMLDKNLIKNILSYLDIRIISENNQGLVLSVPPFRVDVQREVDVIEEILRIYGFNNIPLPDFLRSSLTFAEKPDKEKLQNTVSDYLSANGFNEIMCNSLTNADYVEKLETLKSENNVVIQNPLSKELNVLRQTLLFSGLEAVAYNQNRQNADVKLYEFGKTYHNLNNPKIKTLENYSEFKNLSVLVTGRKQSENWNTTDEKVDFYFIKNIVTNILKRVGLSGYSIEIKNSKQDIYNNQATIKFKGKAEELTIAEFGSLSKKITEIFDIRNEVLFAEIKWEKLLELVKNSKTEFAELPRFPEVRRDLALLLDKNIQFEKIEKIAFETEKKLLKEVNLFDIYEGDKLPEGKKSYAVSYILQDKEKTLLDNEIEKVMDNLVKAYQQQINAAIR